MSRIMASIFIALAIIAAAPAVALAGMPRATLTDIGAMRLQTLSFFAGLFLVSSAIVQKLWNRLALDFPDLPRLSYWRATSLVAAWGLLFIIVLTMISGARELLTPGAWESKGVTYTLKEAEQVDAPPPPSAEYRREGLERLRVALVTYAIKNRGNLPASAGDPAMTESVWEAPGGNGAKYEYIPGLKLGYGRGRQVLAFEPPIFTGNLFVLLTNEEIVSMTPNELAGQLKSQGDTP